MYYMSKDGTRLVESNHLYIDGNTILAVVPGSDDIPLAEYEVYAKLSSTAKRCLYSIKL